MTPGCLNGKAWGFRTGVVAIGPVAEPTLAEPTAAEPAVVEPAVVLASRACPVVCAWSPAADPARGVEDVAAGLPAVVRDGRTGIVPAGVELVVTPLPALDSGLSGDGSSVDGPLSDFLSNVEL